MEMESQNQNNFTWENLPQIFPHLIKEIIGYLDNPNLVKLRVVCKTWKKSIDQEQRILSVRKIQYFMIRKSKNPCMGLSIRSITCGSQEIQNLWSVICHKAPLSVIVVLGSHLQKFLSEMKSEFRLVMFRVGKSGFRVRF